MKKIKYLLVGLVLLLSFMLVSCEMNQGSNNNNQGEEQEVVSKKSFKLLCVGNSFSDNALKYMYPILESFGVENITIANLYIGGCTIDTHYQNALNNNSAYTYRKNTTGVFNNYENATLELGLHDEKWNFITMQQASGSSGIVSTYTNVDLLNGYIREQATNSKVKVFWHMTWAYQQNASHSEFSKYDRDQQKMYQMIVEAVNKKIVDNNKFDGIIPAGSAIQNARTSYVGDTLTIDGYHLNSLGEYIVGLTYVLSITGWSINDMDDEKVPSEFQDYLDIIKESAVNALEKPFEITQSIYIE